MSAHPFDTRNNNIRVQVGQSIQAVIDAAQPGSTITVETRIYTEQVTINKDGISLISEGSILVPPTTPINNTFVGLVRGENGAGICITGSGIQLAPFTTDHRKLLSLEQPVHDVSITGFQIRNFTGENIAVVGGENIKILDNTLYNGYQYGLLSVGSSKVFVSNNAVISEGSLGIIAICTHNNNDTGPTRVLRNHISGYYVGLCIQTPGSTIAFNDVDGSCMGAFVDPGVNGAQVLYNTFRTSDPLCASTSLLTSGVVIDGAVNSLVTSNVINGQRANGTAVGIMIVDAVEVGPVVVATGNSITMNVLRENDADVFANSTGTGNVIAENKCDAC